MWNIVWVSPQGHRSVSASRHFLLQAPQCPCCVRKRFSRDHCCRGRSKPGCRIVWSHTRWELTTWANKVPWKYTKYAIQHIQILQQATLLSRRPLQAHHLPVYTHPLDSLMLENTDTNLLNGQSYLRHILVLLDHSQWWSSQKFQFYLHRSLLLRWQTQNHALPTQ